MEVTGGNIWNVRMLKCFPAKCLKLIPHQIGSIGRVTWKRMIPSDNSRFDFLAHRNTLKHQEINHTSLLFFPCLHFQFWTNALYTTLISRAKKELCGPVRFRYACLLSYIWEYRYVETVLRAFLRNVFTASVRFSFDCPLYIIYELCYQYVP